MLNLRARLVSTLQTPLNRFWSGVDYVSNWFNLHQTSLQINTSSPTSNPKSPLLTTWRYTFTRAVLNMWYMLRQYYITTITFSLYYIQGFTFIFFIDACLTDDEPLWEPIEWSLLQTWLFVIFMFGWIGENLIRSRYGGYTGRDKRVWMAWYRTFWLIEIYYIFNFLIVACFVITPFFFETTYSLPFIYTWWDWYSRAFFFKFSAIITLSLLLSVILQLSSRWVNWRQGLIIVVLINFFLSYLLYTQFFISFFGYLTNPLWYANYRPVDYIQLSHEPNKWGWGGSSRDHFTYHNTKTRFWFKNDGPFSSALMFFNMYMFLSLFFVFLYWVTLFRRIYSTSEIPLTYTTYCVSTLRQLFYCFLFLYTLIFISFITEYWRLPVEFTWVTTSNSWIGNFADILFNYPTLIMSIYNL